MLLFLIRETGGGGCSLHTEPGEEPISAAQIVIPSCANHHDVISADKLSPIYDDN